MTTQPITFKTKDDAPNYVRAASPATSCSTCAAFQMKWCTMYDFDANPSWTCDTWQQKPGQASSWPLEVPKRERMPVKVSLKETVGGNTTFKTFVDKNGRWRWVLTSSNAFEDRDQEVITTKALNRDVSRTDRTGEYGPLRWWHVGKPEWRNPMDWRTVVAGKGLDIGDCDFSAMSGPMLIESGTFRSEALGAAISAKAHTLGASLGFSHPIDEPDSDGVFHHINRFERSLTPANKASNPRTGLVVTQEHVAMDDVKLTAFRALVGEPLAEEVVAGAQETTKSAREAGIREKEVGSQEDVLESLGAQLQALTEQITAYKAGVAATNVPTSPPVAPSAKVEEEEVVEEDGREEGDGSDEVYVGDMTGAEFGELLRGTLGPMFESHTKALDLHGKIAAANDSMKEMKAYLGGMTQKDAAGAELRATVEQLQVSLKEAQDELAALQGNVPRELSQQRPTTYKASGASDNVIPDTHPLFQADGVDNSAVQSPLSWLDTFVTTHTQGAVPGPTVTVQGR